MVSIDLRMCARITISCVMVLLAACSGIHADLPPSSVQEDCATAGDEDGNGLAGCADPACVWKVECQLVCGNGKQEAGEACDDGNTLDGDGCAHDCTSSLCGNAKRETGEACDDGNMTDGDGCDHDCTVTGCGNDIMTAGEACDDGNGIDGDGCDHDCTVTGCGNGIMTTDEACDDGNAIDGDSCDHNCTVTACGNGIMTAPEVCDDGNAIDGDGCDRNCTPTACGNGVVSPGEECDDSNTIDGDGCNACKFSACTSEVPVEPGQGDSLPLPGQITRLIASPTSCFVYALAEGSTSKVFVFSTASKKEVARVTLQRTDDLAVSPSGAYLVTAHATAHKISIIDTARWRVTATVPTSGAPSIIQVDNQGVAYYTSDFYGSSSIYRIELGLALEDLVTTLEGADMALTSNGTFLYAGESGTTGGNLFKYNVSLGTWTVADRTTYNDNYGFSNSVRHVYLSPGGQHIYYAGFQFDAGSLKFMSGSTAEQILAEDVQGTFAIGAKHVFDAKLVRPVATMPHEAKVAVLTAGDQELWYYSAFTQRLHYVNTRDLIDGIGLGVHEVAPGPLSSYRFAKLIHDPVRARLYGVDTTQASVVVIDAVSLQPTRAILVGSTPTDIDLDAAGTTLFVGHRNVQGFARIKLDTLTFDGFGVAPRDTYRLAAVSNDRVVTINNDQWNTPSLLDARTGAVLSEASWVYQAAITTTADRATVFVGESGTSGGHVTRYSVATDQLVATRTGGGFYFPARSITAVSDGSAVYYDGYLVEATDLSTERYEIMESILAVSSDRRLALSSTHVFDVATGVVLGTLPAMTSALAINPAGTKAFVFAGNAIIAVDLTAF